MAEVAIRVDNLSKRYRIGQREPYKTLRGALTDLFKNPFQRRQSGPGFIWALKDVSFEVKEGEVVGIIGPNGAGKTTLLKILSRITEPTQGYGQVCGRVGSLLEVGTGFHLELTGRENIYLSGAILGMRKAEIDYKFDKIVHFAGVEKFIDTPVKRYSSGMLIRLAFSVAAHLEPEILLIDEVLAVGDAAFQKKCLGKMGDVAKGGRTVVFVSHNMGAVNRLCHRAILLQEGRIVDEGVTETVTRKYLESIIPPDRGSEFRIGERPDLTFQILAVAVTDDHGRIISSVGLWEQAFVRVDFLVRKKLFGSNLAMCISRDGNYILQSFDTDLSPELFDSREPGYYRAVIPLPSGLLTPGTYTVTAAAGFMTSVGGVDNQIDVVSFNVVADGEDIEHKSYSRRAVVIARIPWEIEKVRVSRE
jgi:lipopolysaccharide transport system ATP-binding protein